MRTTVLYVAGYKPKRWWFWAVSHGIGNILLGILGVVLADFAGAMSTITLAVISLYVIMLVVLQP